RLPVLLRILGLPGPGGPREDRGDPRAGADRRAPVGGVPARPGAVDRRHRRPPPRGLVLQRQVATCGRGDSSAPRCPRLRRLRDIHDPRHEPHLARPRTATRYLQPNLLWYVLPVRPFDAPGEVVSDQEGAGVTEAVSEVRPPVDATPSLLE